MSSTSLIQLVLEAKRHQARQARLILLLIAKPRDPLSIEEIARAIRQLDVRQRSRAVAHGGNDLVVLVEFVDEFVGGGVGCEVEHGTVAADEEDGFKFASAAEEGGEFLGLLPEVGVF